MRILKFNESINTNNDRTEIIEDIFTEYTDDGFKYEIGIYSYKDLNDNEVSAPVEGGKVIYNVSLEKKDIDRSFISEYEFDKICKILEKYGFSIEYNTEITYRKKQNSKIIGNFVSHFFITDNETKIEKNKLFEELSKKLKEIDFQVKYNVGNLSAIKKLDEIIIPPNAINKYNDIKISSAISIENKLREKYKNQILEDLKKINQFFPKDIKINIEGFNEDKFSNASIWSNTNGISSKDYIGSIRTSLSNNNYPFDSEKNVDKNKLPFYLKIDLRIK